MKFPLAVYDCQQLSLTRIHFALQSICKLGFRASAPTVINFGGDLRANRPPQHGPWQVGIERPDTDREANMKGAGARAYLEEQGVRYWLLE